VAFIVRRLIFYVVAAWVALTINFFIPRLMPGNAVESIMAKFPNLQPSAYRAIEAMLGVGHPGSIWHQYVAYLDDILHFNFGTSVSEYPAQVSTLLAETLPWTIVLVGSATVIAFLVGTALGIAAGWRHGGGLDRTLPGLMFLQAIPYFFLALLLVQDPGRMTFDTKLGVNIDPVGFYERLWHLWNPLEYFGSLQDQYIGYAFPMGAFYLVAHLLHVPVWLAERIWMSLLIAVGIGLHNFGEGLAIGGSAATGAIGLATILVIGFALHNCTEGFGIVAPLAADGDRPSWGFLLLMGAIGGGPTLAGTVVGRQFTSQAMSVIFLTLAAGSILYVVIQLLGVAHKNKRKDLLCWGVLLGLTAGFLTDMVVTAGGA